MGDDNNFPLLLLAAAMGLSSEEYVEYKERLKHEGCGVCERNEPYWKRTYDLHDD